MPLFARARFSRTLNKSSTQSFINTKMPLSARTSSSRTLSKYNTQPFTNFKSPLNGAGFQDILYAFTKYNLAIELPYTLKQIWDEFTNINKRYNSIKQRFTLLENSIYRIIEFI